MHYEVNINNFSGPLDLLLHLIKKDNIDIYDISLEVITKEYLDYINKMKELNLDVASEYLVMACELIEYKSKSLLPKKENDVDEYEEDPKEKLIKKLVDYSKYKEVTSVFKELSQERMRVYTKLPSNIDNYSDKIKNNGNVTIDDLLEALRNFLNRKELDKPLNTKITTKEISVSDRIKYIKDKLKDKDEVNFFELFEEFTKSYVVVTFLSVLEMSKNNEIVIEQTNNFENIVIRRV